jgi:hypothetical protein
VARLQLDAAPLMRPEPIRARADDWPERLAAFIDERRDHGFAWGLQDCFTLAADAALALTGEDPAEVVRGEYSNEEGAEAIIGPDGLEAWVAATMAAWGAPECEPAFAQRGDMVFVAVGNQRMCGVHLGSTVAVPGADRLHFLPASRILRAWVV